MAVSDSAVDLVYSLSGVEENNMPWVPWIRIEEDDT